MAEALKLLKRIEIFQFLVLAVFKVAQNSS